MAIIGTRSVGGNDCSEYRIERGDSLWRIAKRELKLTDNHAITSFIDEVVRLNGLNGPSFIQAGATLLLPTKLPGKGGSVGAPGQSLPPPDASKGPSAAKQAATQLVVDGVPAKVTRLRDRFVLRMLKALAKTPDVAADLVQAVPGTQMGSGRFAHVRFSDVQAIANVLPEPASGLAYAVDGMDTMPSKHALAAAQIIISSFQSKGADAEGATEVGAVSTPTAQLSGFWRDFMVAINPKVYPALADGNLTLPALDLSLEDHLDKWGFTERNLTPPKTVTHWRYVQTADGHTTKQSVKSVSFEQLVRRAAVKTLVPPALIKAVVRIESAFDPTIKSSAGAVGLMQLMPSTAKFMQVSDLRNPEQNVLAGSAFLAEQLNKFDGDIAQALSAYNAGPLNQTIWNEVLADATLTTVEAQCKRFLERYQREVKGRRGYTVPDNSRWLARTVALQKSSLVKTAVPFAETKAYVDKGLATYRYYATEQQAAHI